MHCRLEAAKLAWAKFDQPRLATAKVGQHIAKSNHGSLEWEREQKTHQKNKPKHVSFIEQRAEAKCGRLVLAAQVVAKRCDECSNGLSRGAIADAAVAHDF